MVTRLIRIFIGRLILLANHVFLLLIEEAFGILINLISVCDFELFSVLQSENVVLVALCNY